MSERERTEEQHSTGGGTLALLIQNAISLWLDNMLYVCLPTHNGALFFGKFCY